jgi:hypothetical protein
MRKKRYSLMVLIILGSLLLFSRSYNQPQAVQEPLSAALAAAGVGVQEISINGWAQLAGHDLTTDQLDTLVQQSMEKLGVKDGGYRLTRSASDHHRAVRGEALGDHFQIVATAQVLYPTWAKTGPETYLVINVETIAANGTVDSWQDKIITILMQAGGTPRINTCLVGWLDGKLEEDVWAAKLRAAFAAIDATVIDTVGYTNFASLTGFSRLITDWLKVGDKRININMAMRYSPYDNRTYVTIGSPVITREY